MNERAQLEQAIAALEGQRELLGEAVDASIAALKARLQKLEAPSRQSRRQVTVLYADLSGYTSLSEKMDAEDVGTLMNALWERLDTVIYDYGGQIDKHIGDAVMALWGVNLSREDDPERAVRAGLAIQQEISQFNQHTPIPLQMRVGINSGTVILGEVGTQGEFTATGEAVSVATRLENASPLGGVLIGPEAYHQVRGVFEIEEQTPLAGNTPRGLVRAFLVRRAYPRVFRNPTRGVEGIETHMIGRDAELKMLQQAFRQVMAQNRFGGVTILAEAGLGKSRLLHEFQNWIESLPTPIRLLKARAEEQSLNAPLGMVRDLLAGYFNLGEEDTLAEIHAKLEAGLIDLFGPSGLEKAHFIGQMLGYDYSTSPLIAPLLDDAARIYSRAAFYLVQLLNEAAKRTPLVILMDDLHWADEASLGLIEMLINEQSRAPILLVWAARPTLTERQPDWGNFPGHLRLTLQALTEEDSRLLVRAILRKAPEVPAAMQEMILRKSDGNPFYLEELIKMLIEVGVIQKGEQWTVNDALLKEVPIPTTLKGVLQARLDKLQPDERDLLARAAVVGRIFWDSAVAYLGQENPDLVEAGLLAELANKELVFRRPQSTFESIAEYTFKHIVLREVTYEQVLKSRRRIYHRRAAEWLAQTSGERADEYAALIARHYERAGENQSAGQWYARAAWTARNSYALETAIGHFRKALEYLGEYASPLELFTLYDGLGAVLVARSELQEASACFEHMLEIAEDLADPNRQAQALNQLWQIEVARSNYPAAVQVAERAEGFARQSIPRDNALLAQSIWQKAIVYFRQGSLGEALKSGSESLRLSETAGARPQIASNYNLLNLIYLSQGDYETAIGYAKNSLAIWRDLRHREFEAGLLSNLGEAYRLSGDYLRAVEHYQQALELATQIGALSAQASALGNLGRAQVGLGQYDKAIENLHRTLEFRQEDTQFTAEVHFSLAEALLASNQPFEALQHALRALILILKVDYPEYQGVAWRVLGQVLSHLGQTATIPRTAEPLVVDAQTCFENSEQLLRQNGMQRELALTLWQRARHEVLCGDRQKGHEFWQQAHELLTALKLHVFLVQLEQENHF